MPDLTDFESEYQAYYESRLEQAACMDGDSTTTSVESSGCDESRPVFNSLQKSRPDVFSCLARRKSSRRLSERTSSSSEVMPEENFFWSRRSSKKSSKKSPSEAKTQTSVNLELPPELVDLDDVDYAEQHAEELEHQLEPVVSFKDSWKSRSNLANFMTRNHHFHMFIVTMVMVDVLIVLSELFFDLEVLTENDCRSSKNCPTLRRVNGTDMDGHACHFHHNYTECIYNSGKKRCLPPGSHHDVNPADVLHYLGLGVLSFFVLEVTVKVLVLGAHFFHHKLEVFDAIVVVVSFILDLTIGGHSNDGVSLLILLRFWRVTRILNGVMVAIEEQEREKRHHLKHKLNLTEEEVRELKELIHVLRKEVSEWRERAGIPRHAADVNGIGVTITHLDIHSHLVNTCQSTKEESMTKAVDGHIQSVWKKIATVSRVSVGKRSSGQSNSKTPSGSQQEELPCTMQTISEDQLKPPSSKDKSRPSGDDHQECTNTDDRKDPQEESVGKDEVDGVEESSS